VRVLDAALLRADNLWRDFDGKLVVNPSISQTHGHCQVSGSANKSATWQIFHGAVDAAGSLNIDDFGVHRVLVSETSSWSTSRSGALTPQRTTTAGTRKPLLAAPR
jgi:hypothetical protein